MVKKEFVEQMAARQQFRNLWHTDLTHSIQADCPFCCLAFWCGPCTSYMLRKRALYGDMSRYVCCAGYLPCSGQCGEQSCPELCLCTEVWCCFANSVQATRFLLQDEFNIQTTKCDNCIIAFMFCLTQVACIFSLVAALVGSEEIEAASQILTCASDAVYCSVCACLQTQHKVEMDKRDGVFGEFPMRAPQQQVMVSRFDQPIPPGAGYPVPYASQSTYPSSYGPPQVYPQTHPIALQGQYQPPGAGYPMPYASQSTYPSSYGPPQVYPQTRPIALQGQYQPPRYSTT